MDETNHHSILIKIHMLSDLVQCNFSCKITNSDLFINNVLQNFTAATKWNYNKFLHETMINIVYADYKNIIERMNEFCATTN